ncbi:MAG: rhamnogalacturonan lyase [Polyangiaceae bacterium]
MNVRLSNRTVSITSRLALSAAILLPGCGGSDSSPTGQGGSPGTQSTDAAGASSGGATGLGGNVQGTGGSDSPSSGGSRALSSSNTLVNAGASSSAGTSSITTSGGASTGGANTGGANTGGANIGGGTAKGGTTASGSTASGGTASGGTTTVGSCPAPTAGHYQMEDLDRGVVAVKVSNGVYVGWRMMGYEYNPTSPTSIAYNVYRDGTKLATVTNSTNYLDTAGNANSKYSVSAVMSGTECPKSSAVATWAQNYLTIPLSPPGSDYSPNDASPGDLDGDGRLDIVLKWDPSNSKDNSLSGTTGNVYIDGYTLSGTRLFRIDLGPNIRAGAHYTQMSVYDFDGDGKAEIAVKTAPGTKDGTGAYLKRGPAASDDDSAVYRNSGGYILTGPEYLTVFSGTNGAELGTVNYPVPRGTVSGWGDSYGNRVDRFNGGIAFVKEGGKATGKPSIIQQRGYYTRLTVSSLLWRNGTLSTNWIFDSSGTGNSKAAGQGNHQAMAADTNNDGAQEIITGATTIASNGTLQCTTGKGHGDAMHVSELIKGKGISVFTVHEGGTYGHDVHDAATCSIYIDIKGSSDNGRGVADWVSTTAGTAATCSSGVGIMNCQTGATTSPSAGSNFLIYWDADEARELEDGTTITKPGGSALLSASGCASNNTTKSTPTLTADLLGDWREEVIYRTSDNTALRIYTTTAVTARRIYTLMHDPTYRAQVSFENSAYNQPPHPGFHIGPGMADPPKPDIYVK